MTDHFIFSRLPRAAILRLTLLSIAMLDELIAGFAVVALPLLRNQLGLNYQQVGLLFSVGACSALILDPFVNLLSDRGSKRWWILGGLIGLAVGFALAGSTRNFQLLLVAFALTYPAGGAAVGLAEAALIDSAPHAATRTMTRWTLMSGSGDILSPLVVAAFVALGLGWSALCWFAVAVWLSAGLIILPQRFPRPASLPDDDDDKVSILAGLREALRDPLLLRWAALAILPTMLDEVFIGFVALYLGDVLHAGQVVIGGSIVVQMCGSFLGLLIVDRLVGRVTSRRLMIWLALLALVGVIGLLSTHSILLATAALFIIGLGEAGLYPIAQAEAYARLPGRSGTVRAVIGLGMPFEIALPGAVGLVAARFGILAGVGLLGTAPFLILLLLPWRIKN